MTGMVHLIPDNTVASLTHFELPLHVNLSFQYRIQLLAETAPKIGLVAHFNLGLVAHINFGLSARFNFGLIA